MNYYVYSTHRQTPSGFRDNLAKEGLIDKHVITQIVYTCKDRLLAHCLYEICSGCVGAPEIMFSVEHPSTLAFVLDMHHLFEGIAMEHDICITVLTCHELAGVIVGTTCGVRDAQNKFYNFWQHIWSLYKAFREAIQQPMRNRQR